MQTSLIVLFSYGVLEMILSNLILQNLNQFNHFLPSHIFLKIEYIILKQSSMASACYIYLSFEERKQTYWITIQEEV